MNPKIKATIALPFTIAILAFLLISLATHPMVFVWMLIIPSAIAIIGSLWYSLYVMFGGNDANI